MPGGWLKLVTFKSHWMLGEVKSQDPYSIYGSQVPRVIPDSKQYWKSFGLDLVVFVQRHGLPDY